MLFLPDLFSTGQATLKEEAGFALSPGKDVHADSTDTAMGEYSQLAMEVPVDGGSGRLSKRTKIDTTDNVATDLCEEVLTECDPADPLDFKSLKLPRLPKKWADAAGVLQAPRPARRGGRSALCRR